ncbi:MAG: adenylate/guanylate cyclase domain-containing protein [Candidatus Baltobacteraceae bacterium]
MRPSGNVVFLFSDIEGSTARWDSNPEAMQDVLRRHDDLMRGAVESCGGFVFKTIGDAFCVAFPTARDAVRGALSAQRRLRDEDWSSVEGLRVRMAIHAGDADERDNDYFGTAVNRVARLLATAHGGQVVLSGVVADLLETQPLSEVSIRPLGTYRLKDLQQPERVYQLFAPDLPADFKPLRALDAAFTNLPVQSTAFIGRESDIAGVGALLREATLVTLSGPGGVGKTRLALQCAADLQDKMSDGVWFVNLASLTDAALIATTVLTALGAARDGDMNGLDSLTAHLKSRELLLVLDNCEHLVDEAARVICAIRERCAQVTVLTTSREVLHLPGERVYRLLPLPQTDAIRLFVQRAQIVSPTFTLTQANTPVLEDICTHLDGIPLAVELAAARVRVLSLEELLGRLSERFRLLSGGDRTALPRQQTLRALIDWSFDLLTDDEKALFRRLSIFNGTFTSDAASSVCADDALDEWTIFDLLSSLVDKSLLVADVEETRQRYHLLESIHEYARHKLEESGPQSETRYAMLGVLREYAQSRVHEAGEALWLGQRHAVFFARTAGKLYTEWDKRPSFATVTQGILDLANFRAALHWTLDEGRDSLLGAQLAGDVAPIFLQLSLLDEGIEWGNRALQSIDGTAVAVRARLEYVLSMLYNNQVLYSRALESSKRAIALYRRTQDERGTIRALSQVAQQYARAGRFEQARPYSEEAIEHARAAGDARLLGGVIRRCAAALPPAQIEEARSLFGGAVTLLRSLQADDEACEVLEWWAEAEAAAECFERAVQLGVESLACAKEGVVRMYRTSNIAGYSLAANEFGRAQPFIREALTLAVQARHPLLMAIGIAYSATLRADGDPQEAARLFGYARARMSALNWEGICSDRIARENIIHELGKRVAAVDLDPLFAQGASWSEDEALACALEH